MADDTTKKDLENRKTGEADDEEDVAGHHGPHPGRGEESGSSGTRTSGDGKPDPTEMKK